MVATLRKKLQEQVSLESPGNGPCRRKNSADLSVLATGRDRRSTFYPPGVPLQ